MKWRTKWPADKTSQVQNLSKNEKEENNCYKVNSNDYECKNEELEKKVFHEKLRIFMD